MKQLPDPDGMVEVSADYLAELEKCSRFMCALEAAGVDNWEGYQAALEILADEESVDE